MILEGISSDALLVDHEAFAPILILHKFDDLEQLYSRINNSPYGIHVGLYTNDIRLAFDAWEKLDAAGVVIGQVPSWRSDKMPYGGIKNSGLGREGIKYAIDEMTELKTSYNKKALNTQRL